MPFVHEPLWVTAISPEKGMSNVRQRLAGIGFGQFADAFEQNRIGLDIARDLTDQDLRDLGVSALGDRKLLLRAIASLKETTQEIPTDKSATQAVAPVHEGERRQLTVLLCDMVGFTELANRVDSEVLQRIIRSYEDACAVCITRYEGYVMAFTRITIDPKQMGSHLTVSLFG